MNSAETEIPAASLPLPEVTPRRILAVQTSTGKGVANVRFGSDSVEKVAAESL